MDDENKPGVLPGSVRESTCPACGYHVAVDFFDGGSQPLATIAWPTSAVEARNLPRLPLDFVCCVGCSHIYNASFEYGQIPYSEKPNLMFNEGAIWSSFIREVRARILELLSADPVVVEIGHGDGSFLASLARGRRSGRFIGFDPHGAMKRDEPVILRPEIFDPQRHLKELQPDLIITRHVLEHLIDPLGFLQQISFISGCLGMAPLAYFEVPCIDRVLATGRTVDFYYEHSSQFTTRSFTRMLAGCAADVIDIGHGYDGEVVYGFLRLGQDPDQIRYADEARLFYAGSRDATDTIRAQLSELYNAGKRVAVWGGTGKSAAFMQHYGMDEARFPIVVDDDINKADTFVPGTGQRIRFRDWLLDNPVDVIIIPPQWRAADIVAVMKASGIRAQTVLIEHRRRLTDFHEEDHPYRRVTV